MIVQGIDPEYINKPLRLGADDGLIVTPYLLTSSGLAIALDSSQRVKVLLDAVTGNVPVNIAASGINVPVNIAASGINVPVNIAASGINVPVEEVYKIGDQMSASQDRVEETNLSAGTNNLLLSTPSLGYQRVLRWLCVRYVGTVTSVKLRIVIYDGSGYRYLNDYSGITNGTYYGFSCDIPIWPTWRPGVQVTGATAGDAAYVYAFYADYLKS